MSRRRVLIGIGGDSGSGRATFAEGLADILGRENVIVLSADGYLRFDREERKASGLTPLDPECHHLDVLARDLASLSRGEAVLLPGYDHVSGKRVPAEYIESARVILIEGLLLFHTRQLRELFHLKVFLEPDEELRREWKLRRDVGVRGRDRADILSEISARESDAREFLRPQRDHADIVVRFHASPVARKGDADVDAELVVRPGPSLVRRAFEALADGGGLGGDSIQTADVSTGDGGRADVIEIGSTIDAADAAAITAALSAAMLLVGSSDRPPPRRRPVPNHPLAVAQAVVAYQAFADRAAESRLRRELERYGVTMSRKATPAPPRSGST